MTERSESPGAFAPSFSFGIVAARFNPEVAGKLLANCIQALADAGVPDSKIVTVRVPGCFELPWAAQEMALSKKFDAIICLGAILKGQTPQNDYLASSVFFHLHSISLATRVPCVTGILTPNNYGQALARTRGKLDRGREAALAAIDMAKRRWGFGGALPAVETAT